MIVTTTSRPTPEMRDRARRVAARCGAPLVERRGALGDELAYVVGRDRDELRGHGARLAVHLGLLHARVRAGRAHPLVATVAPRGADRVVDATLGLALDALHLSAVLGCEIVGVEGSPAIYSLLEEGLPRLAAQEPAAERVRACFADATTALSGMGADSADAVYLSPMFATPRKAAPGFQLLRAVAVHAPLDAALVRAACRVARDRVVVKVAPGETLPAGREVERVRGAAVDYVVLSPSPTG